MNLARIALALLAALPLQLFADEAADNAKFGIKVTTTGLVPAVVEGQALSALDHDFSSDATPLSVDLRPRFTLLGLRGAGHDLVQVRTSLGTFNAELLADGTDAGAEDLDPHVTVNNFKSYLATDATTAKAKTYDGTIFHRSANLGNIFVPRKIVQGGGFRANADLSPLAKKAPIVREFRYANTRGTIAMARTSVPDSATSEWFINLNDNTPVFNTTGDNTYAVFARIIGNGMSVADRIGNLPTYNLGNAFTQLPLQDVSPTQTQLFISNLVTIRSVRVVPLQPADTGKGGSVLTYSFTNDNPSAAGVTVSPAGRLVVTKGKRGGKAIITVKASEAGGSFVESKLTVTHPGPPFIVKQVPDAAKAALGTSLTLSADITAWPLFIRWQRLPAGLADLPANWIDIALDDARFEGADTEYLKIKLTGANATAVGEALDLDGSKFRFRLANSAESAAPVLSRPTVLKISTTLAFAGKLPANTNADLGSTIRLSSPAAGGTYPAPNYQWQRKAPGGDWTDLVDSKAAVKGTGTDANPQFPAVASPYSGTKTSTLTLRLNGTTPASSAAAINTLDTLALHLSQYRCVISHDRGDGVLSVPGSVTTLRIKTVPVGVAAQPGKLVHGFLSHTPGDITNKATISVAAKTAASNTPVKYQWQRLNPATKEWENLVNHVAPTEGNPGAPTPYLDVTTATLTIRLPADLNTTLGYGLTLDGAQYRCVLTNILKDAPAPFDPAAGQAISNIATFRIISGVLFVVTDNSFVVPGIPAPTNGRVYSAKGLPPGLTINPATGFITGVTAKPGVYKVVVTVTDGAFSQAVTHYIMVSLLNGGTPFSFEALLSPPDGPHYAKLAIEIAGNGAFTGTLTTAIEPNPLPLKGSVVRDYDTMAVSLKAPVVIARPGAPAGRVYRLVDLVIDANGHLSAKLQTRANATATPVEIASAIYISDQENSDYPGNPGSDIGRYNQANPAPWANVGSYNLAITAPTPLAADPGNRPVPAGSGYAIAPVQTDGRLNFKGKLPDGTPFTISARGGSDRNFRLFIRPYGTAATGGVFSGELPMSIPAVDYPRHAVDGDAGKDAYWAKPALPASANYRAGFGPLGLTLRLEPWFPNSFSDLGFLDDTASGKGKIDLAISGVDLGSSAAELPSTLGVTYSPPIAPFADFSANDTSEFKGTLDTSTGFLKGTFRLVDSGVVRNVAFEGTLLMAYDLDVGTVTAEGFFLLPAPGANAAEAKSGRIQFKSLHDDPNDDLDP